MKQVLEKIETSRINVYIEIDYVNDNLEPRFFFELQYWIADSCNFSLWVSLSYYATNFWKTQNMFESY